MSQFCTKECILAQFRVADPSKRDCSVLDPTSQGYHLLTLSPEQLANQLVFMGKAFSDHAA